MPKNFMGTGPHLAGTFSSNLTPHGASAAGVVSHMISKVSNITLFRSMTMLCGTNNILQNISVYKLNVKNTP